MVDISADHCQWLGFRVMLLQQRGDERNSRVCQSERTSKILMYDMKGSISNYVDQWKISALFVMKKIPVVLISGLKWLLNISSTKFVILAIVDKLYLQYIIYPHVTQSSSDKSFHIFCWWPGDKENSVIEKKKVEIES